MYYISEDLRRGNLEELGIDLLDSDLSGTQKGQIDTLLLSYTDIFSKSQRDIGKYSTWVQHHTPPKT